MQRHPFLRLECSARDHRMLPSALLMLSAVRRTSSSGASIDWANASCNDNDLVSAALCLLQTFDGASF